MATGRVPTTANSPLTAKGDLFTYSTAPARLAVGTNGDTIVADSSTSTGLRYKEDYAAGKNAVINAAFNVWQRGTSFTAPAIFSYTADRWQTIVNGTAIGLVVSQQAFTAGTAPVAGYEGTFFLRQVTTGQTGGSVQALATRLEDVRLFANDTVTLSFWAKADASRTWTSRLTQSFGSGGSGDVTTSGSSLSVTTSWTRFTQTFTVPSIAGKTIGAGSYLYVIIDGSINTGQTMDIWGVQLEGSPVATSFQTATGTIQGELAACQRYYWRSAASTNGGYADFGFGSATSTTAALILIPFPVTMRTYPTAIDYSTMRLSDFTNATAAATLSINTDQSNASQTVLNVTGITGLTQYRPYALQQNGNSAAYVGLSAEL